MNYEKSLVDILHEHNNPRFRGQNGWIPEGWRSITQMFNEKFPLAQFSKAQIQEKEKELKANYKLIKEARKQSGAGWNDSLGMINALPPIWDRIIKNHPKMKKFQSKPFPLYNQLELLYQGSCATGDLNFTSTQQLAPVQQVSNPQDDAVNEAVSSFRNDDLELDSGLNPSSSNVQRHAVSSTHADLGTNDRTPASSDCREDSHGRKCKQNQIAGVLEDFLQFKKEQSNKFISEVNQPSNERSKEEYSIGKCVAILESMEDLSEEEMAKALGVFKCEENREIFMTTKRARVRLLWLRDEINKQVLSPRVSGV